MTSVIDAWRKKMSGKYPKTPEPAAISPKGTIYQRKLERVPTQGSQRRCYNGCFPSSDWETVWGPWEFLSINVPESKMEFWENLGGPTNRIQYKWEPNEG